MNPENIKSLLPHFMSKDIPQSVVLSENLGDHHFNDIYLNVQEKANTNPPIKTIGDDSMKFILEGLHNGLNHLEKTQKESNSTLWIRQLKSDDGPKNEYNNIDTSLLEQLTFSDAPIDKKIVKQDDHGKENKNQYD